MEFKDFKDLSVKELAKKGKAATAELFTAKMKNSLGQLSNPLEIRRIRKDVARIKTAMAQNAKGRGNK